MNVGKKSQIQLDLFDDACSFTYKNDDLDLNIRVSNNLLMNLANKLEKLWLSNKKLT